jgi:hypothetical protein
VRVDRHHQHAPNHRNSAADYVYEGVSSDLAFRRWVLSHWYFELITDAALHRCSSSAAARAFKPCDCYRTLDISLAVQLQSFLVLPNACKIHVSDLTKIAIDR